MAHSGVETLVTCLATLALTCSSRAEDPGVSHVYAREDSKAKMLHASQPAAVPVARLGQPSLAPPGPLRMAGSATASDASPALGFQLNLSPPEPRELFRFATEEKLRQRLRAYLSGFPDIEFPPTGAQAPLGQPSPRIWPQLVATAEPAYICHQRLWFEQPSSERYGWDLGILQPFISTGVFYTDLAFLPLHWVSSPGRWFDCSAGQCLPGDPVPLLWNPVFSK